MIIKIVTQSAEYLYSLSFRHAAAAALVAPIALFAYFSDINAPQKSHLEEILERGLLKVATRNGPTTYYEDNHGMAGMEYDLARKFADELDLELEIVLGDSINELVQLLSDGEADLIASGMPLSETTDELVRYSRVYQQVEEQVVDLQKAKPRPRNVEDLIAPLSVQLTANHLETVGALRQAHPDLEVKIEHDLEFDELIEKVVNKQTRYALANSNEIQAIRHFYPELRIAFTLPESKGLAWAVKNTDDVSLIEEINNYLLSIKSNGFLTELLERYYGHVETFDYSGTRLFMGRIAKRLPRYEKIFKEAGRKFAVDWRLLAAMSHQESQWNRKATSVTGVRGLMMLTLATSSQLGVTNRLDPEQSIMGGAKYFVQLKDRLPESITEPDRTWMALASYNVGYGHVMDARVITEMLEEDPDKWINIKKNLPLLRKRKWYKQVKHGYAPRQRAGSICAEYPPLLRNTQPHIQRQNPGATTEHLLRHQRMPVRHLRLPPTGRRANRQRVLLPPIVAADFSVPDCYHPRWSLDVRSGFPPRPKTLPVKITGCCWQHAMPRLHRLSL